MVVVQFCGCQLIHEKNVKLFHFKQFAIYSGCLNHIKLPTIDINYFTTWYLIILLECVDLFSKTTQKLIWYKTMYVYIHKFLTFF